MGVWILIGVVAVSIGTGEAATQLYSISTFPSTKGSTDGKGKRRLGGANACNGR